MSTWFATWPFVEEKQWQFLSNMMGWTGQIILKICDKFEFLQKGDPNTHNKANSTLSGMLNCSGLKEGNYYLMSNKGDK